MMIVHARTHARTHTRTHPPTHPHRRHARLPLFVYVFTLFLSTMPWPVSCIRSFSTSHLVMSPFQYST